MSSISGFLGKLTGSGDFFGARSGAEATAKQLQSSREALEETRRQFDIGQERLEPFFAEAVPALGLQAAFSGARGPEAQREAFADFQEDPGTEFLRGEGLRLINSGAGATGGLGGGERLRELTRFSQGLALQDVGRRFSQLGVISGAGQTAATESARLGERFGQNVSGIFGQQANIIGAGQQAQQQSKSNLIGTAAGLAAAFFSDIRLKENIRKVGELDSGLGLYTWDWTDEALEFVGDQVAEGVLANEVMTVFPDAVTDVGGFLTVDYRRIH